MFRHLQRLNLNSSRILAGALLACVLLTGACKSDYPASAQQNPQGPGQEARRVKMARVEEMPVGSAVVVTGTLAAQDQSTVAVKVAGRLRSINVDLGTLVRRGQPIAQVEPQDYQLRVEQAQAALGQARARLGLAPEGSSERVDPEQTGTVRQARAVMEEARISRERAVQLVESGVIARAEYDATDASYKVAYSRYQDAIEEIRNRQALLVQRRTEVDLAKQQLIGTVVYAPFDGVVEQKIASIGEFLAGGAPVATIVKVNPLRFRAEVPERDAPSVRAGQRVQLTVEGDMNKHSGRVVRLSPSITEQNRILVVEAEVANNGNLRPGSFARAEIVTDDASMAVTVPASAVIVFAGIEKVITVEGGKAKEKTITTGRRLGEFTEVLAGVNVGESVVADPGNLQSGQAVTVD